MTEKLFGGLTARQMLAELYRNFLDREPDPLAYEKAARLEAGQAKVEDLIGEIIGSTEYNAPPPPAKLTNDQTQFGEFEMLLGRWIELSVPNPIVVDVGARGRERSNSFDLLKTFGWRGILVEANPNLVESIKADFADLDIEVIECAVSDYDGEATFYLGVNDDVSSLNEHASLGWGPVAGQITVPVRRLGPLLRDRGIPQDFGLLSVDIEGEDIRVLNDLIVAFDYRPRWVVIEASLDFSTTSLDDLPFAEEVKSLYALVGQTSANLILELKDLPPRVAAIQETSDMDATKASI